MKRHDFKRQKPNNLRQNLKFLTYGKNNNFLWIIKSFCILIFKTIEICGGVSFMNMKN